MLSHSVHCFSLSQSADGRGTHFLFVDNLLPTEIVIGFSALVHWGESVEESKDTWTCCTHSVCLFTTTRIQSNVCVYCVLRKGVINQAWFFNS